ncbi:MAG: dTDP-glucose 4,6-dehydratase [Candidatus Omnitrophica bacterium]|nr:dTDP-glucose 4,6-dehydratase [Candidatus Omnitrophota bacterium]
MKKILVTGGAGFIGSEFVRQIARRGDTVMVLDALTYAGDKARLSAVKGQVSFKKVDICNASMVFKMVKNFRPDSIVHFAAETHVDRSIKDGQVFLQTNIMGTQTMLEAARLLGVARLVHISTDEVYGDVARGSSAEDAPFRPNSPYSVSKAAADLLVSSYFRTYGLPVNIVRASNNYGPWQFPEKLIPVVIYKALHNLKVPVYARGLNVREWLHVADCARGIIAVMEKGAFGAAYNIGSGIHRRNIEVVKAVLQLTGRPGSLIEYVADRPGHDFRYSINCARIQKELGWRPQVDLDTGLAETVAWYKANQGWLDRKTGQAR